MNFIGKFKRELVVFLSKTCVRSAQNDYFGLDLKYPIVYGMGRGYVIPKEIWMGQCLDAFLLSKQGCVIDVGVNVGVYLVKLKVLRDDVEYIGFEPNAVCNYYTNELIRMNKFKKARVLPVALSNELSVKTLYASKLGDKTASLVVETTTSDASLEYSSDIVTVEGDMFIEMLGVKELAVIKVDVEGAELIVLNGLIKTIEDKINITFRYSSSVIRYTNPKEFTILHFFTFFQYSGMNAYLSIVRCKLKRIRKEVVEYLLHLIPININQQYYLFFFFSSLGFKLSVGCNTCIRNLQTAWSIFDLNISCEISY